MKAWAGGLAATAVLSLAVWTFFYALTPETPLTPPETLVVVGACAAVVLLGRRAWSRLRRKRDGNGQEP